MRFRYAGRNDMVTSSSGYGFLNKTPDGKDVRATFSYPMYQQFVADNRSMTDLLACAPFGRVNVFVDGQSEIANAFISSGNYYQMLGVSARIGRTILPEDDRPTATPVAVISSKYWHSRFGTDPAVVGKVIKVNNVPVTIVGVIAPGFSGIQQPVANPPDISLPLALDPQLSTNTGTGPPRVSQATYWWLQVMGRLKPGMSAAQAQGNLEGVFQQTARSGLEGYLESLSDEERSRSSNKSRTEVPRLLVEPGGRGFYDISTNEFRSVALLAVVVALVLLIVCANVANLLLSRATTQAEGALGAAVARRDARAAGTPAADRKPAAGGARRRLGVVVGYWGKQLLPGAADVPRPFDWRVLTFVFAVSGLTGLIFGILPALRGTGMNVNSALKETSRGVVGSRSWASKILLAVQVAISLVLLVGAGLFLRTLTNLRHVDIGFNPQNLLLFRVNPQLNRYDEKRTLALYGKCSTGCGAVPGVSAVALSAPALLSGSVNGTSIFVHGRAYAPDVRDRDNNINRLVVSPNFFDVMGIPVLSGRGFGDRDSDTAPKVVMINQAAAKKYFAKREPGRAAVWQQSRNRRTARGGRHRSRRQVRQRSRRGAANDVRALRADAGRQRGVRGANTERPGGRDRRGPRGGAADRPEPAGDGRLDAARTGRDAVSAGEVLRAGLHALRHRGAAAGRARAVRLDVLQRRAPHQRDRDPDGARRTAPGRVAPGDARVDDPGDRRRRCRPCARALRQPLRRDPALRRAAHRRAGARTGDPRDARRVRRRRLHSRTPGVARRSDGGAALRVRRLRHSELPNHRSSRQSHDQAGMLWIAA